MGYLVARTLDEALAALALGPVAVIAGGTDWFPQAGEVLTALPMLDVTRLPGFSGITRQGGLWRIGAATTWGALSALPPGFDALKQAALQVGSVQVQNAGTIAGNLCNASPAADGVPPLLVLGARVELVSPRGVRVLALEDFLLGPRRTARAGDELVSAVLIPDPGARVAGFAKLGTRAYLVISLAMVAASLEVVGGRVRGARVAVGACSPVARRLSVLEERLEGHPVDAPLPLDLDCLAGLAPITDIRATEAYRSEAVLALLDRLLGALIAKGARDD